MEWIQDRGAYPVHVDRLRRIDYLGVASTGPDGSYVPPPHDGPQAFMVVQGAQVGKIPAHFHSVQQFQYVASGSGTIAGRPLARGVVHYADGFTPYGPICAGPTGLTYATLRPCHDTGVNVMPAAQDRLAQLLGTPERLAANRRQFTVDLLAQQAEAAASDGSRWIDRCERSDGLRIAVVSLPARATAPPVTAGGAGAFLLVVDGTMEGERESYRTGSIRWNEAGEPVRQRAGGEGARLALLQFPAPVPVSPVGQGEIR
jgi:hypothetical protein